MKLKLLEQYVRLLVEAATQFSLEELQKLTTPKEIMAYLTSTLGKPLGGGVARVAFALDDKAIIKVAYDGEISHNTNEMKNANCLTTKYAIKVLEYDEENYLWIMEERLKTLTEEEFSTKWKELTGLDMNPVAIRTMLAVSAHFPLNKSHEELGSPYGQQHDQLMQSNKWYQGLMTGLSKCKVDANDLHYKNWGIRPSSGEMILLDLGF